MAKGTLGQVIQRAISDAAFRNRLRTDPGGALSGFDLTPAERAALQSGDAKKLASFGVDQRMSKAFAMGEAASGVSRIVGTDVDMGSIITDGGTPLGTNAILDDADGSVRSAIRDDGGPFDSGSVDSNTGATFNAIRDDGGPFDSGSVGTGADTTLSPIRDDGGPFDSGSVGAGTADSGGTSAFLTADESGNDAVGGGSAAAGSSLDVSGQTNDGSAASVAATDDSGGTSAFLTADEQGNNVVGTGGSAAAGSSLDVSGQTNDGSAASVAASDSNATDAFLTADEMGNNVSASATTAGGWDGPSGTAHFTADEAGGDQSANSDAAKADPASYGEQPEPTA